MEKKPLILWGKRYKSRAEAIRKLGLSDYSQLESIIRYAENGMNKQQALEQFFKPSPSTQRRRYFTEVLRKNGFWGV